MSEEWDTSAHAESEGDKYNKFTRGNSFTGAAPADATADTQAVTDKVAGMAVADDEGNGAMSPPPVAVKTVASLPQPAAAAAAAAAPSHPLRPTAGSVSSVGSASKGPTPRKGSAVPKDAPEFLKAGNEGTGTAFTEKLSPEALAFFNELCNKPFSDQAVAFLNAYWPEVGSQAEFIFSVAWPTMKYADMHSKGVQYIHLYKEGNDLDFNIGLYFYEQLCKLVLDDDKGKPWREDKKFQPSVPEMMTAIKRKIELREKVDCNFDGRVSFLEYLLYQYQNFANPADFTFRAMKTEHLEEHPEIVKARKALADVNAAIQAYEAEKHRLTTEAEKPGVKGLGAKHQLAILDASPLAEKLNKALITAEAAVRIACRKFGGVAGNLSASSSTTQDAAAPSRKPTEGSIWWLQRDLEEKQKLYGPRKK